MAALSCSGAGAYILNGGFRDETGGFGRTWTEAGRDDLERDARTLARAVRGKLGDGWQQEIREVDCVTRHFFRGTEFQNWSLNHPRDRAAVADWREYKQVAKQYIYEFTGDDEYRSSKTKEPSLKSVMVQARRRERQKIFVYMNEDYQAEFRCVKRRKRKR